MSNEIEVHKITVNSKCPRCQKYFKIKLSINILDKNKLFRKYCDSCHNIIKHNFEYPVKLNVINKEIGFTHKISDL